MIRLGRYQNNTCEAPGNHRTTVPHFARRFTPQTTLRPSGWCRHQLLSWTGWMCVWYYEPWGVHLCHRLEGPSGVICWWSALSQGGSAILISISHLSFQWRIFDMWILCKVFKRLSCTQRQKNNQPSCDLCERLRFKRPPASIPWRTDSGSQSSCIFWRFKRKRPLTPARGVC